MGHAMMKYITIIFLAAMLILPGCSSDTPITQSFSLAKGSEIEIQREINTSHRDKELIFTLVDVPESKKDRDYSDLISISLIDISGKIYNPEKISDANGARSDIIAVFNNVPNGTEIRTIRIRALQDLKGTGIRWWSGTLL
jgi:hypothetical protein